LKGGLIMKKIVKAFKVMVMNVVMGFADFLVKLHTRLMPPQAALLNYAIGNMVIHKSIYVAAELGIADILKDGPKSIDQLAEMTGTDRDSLHRLMRTLTGAGIFRAKKNGYIETNKLGIHLQSDLEDSMYAFIKMVGENWIDDIWKNLLQTTRTGKDYYENTYGVNFFDWLKTNEDAQKEFDIAMTSISVMSDAPVAEAYDFSKFSSLVDVGAGHGSQMVSILKNCPLLKGVVFDAPDVIKTLNKDEISKQIGSSERLEYKEGNFFESVPAGYEAYFMKSILHDWDDEKALKILQNCRKAMRGDSTLLVVEYILKDDENKPDFGKVLDINVLALMGGRVRTREECRSIFENAGLELIRIVPTLSPFVIIEAKPI
jgi:DNA-binding Lrp family transcriptional regulator